MLRDKINWAEFRLFGEILLLIRLRLKKLFGKVSTKHLGVLVIDTCIIGDFVATLPALRVFIEHQTQDVDLVVTPPLKSLAESIRGIRKVYTARSIYRRSNQGGEEHESMPTQYDHVMVLRISPESYRILSSIRYSKLTIYDVPFFKYIGHLITTTALKRQVRQWSDVNFEMIGMKKPARQLGFDDIFDLNESDYAQMKDLLPLPGHGKKIIVHTGSGWSVKLWNNSKWVELLRKLNERGDFTFMVVGGTEFEQKSFEFIQSKLDFTIYSLINKVDLRTVLLLMRTSDYFVGIDSGPRNLAHLADLRSVSMLGPSPNNFMPLKREDVVIDRFTCRCKSLYYLHKTSAMDKITADEVCNAFLGLSGISASKRALSPTM